MKNKYILCSKCFHNKGLILESEKIGIQDDSICLNCKNNTGVKLNETLIETLIENFFVKGSVNLNSGTFESIYKVLGESFSDINFDYTLKNDYKLLMDNSVDKLNYNAPALWRLGETDFTSDLRESINTKEKEKIDKELDKIIKISKTYTIKKGTKLFRIRLNAKDIHLDSSFDSAPLNISKEGRLNSNCDSVFYGAFDIETCIHEVRTTVYDEIILVTYEANEDIVLIDLEKMEDTIYDNPQWGIIPFIEYEFYSPQYNFTQLIAKRIKELGFKGIKYKSFYSKVRDDIHSNFALFGFPLKEEILKIHSLNRIRLNNIKYDFTIGSVYEERNIEDKKSDIDSVIRTSRLLLKHNYIEESEKVMKLIDKISSEDKIG